MDNRGLIQKYKVNYPLTQDEIYRHLPQNKRCGVKPWYQLSVIRMNSTYLECIDKFFWHKGVFTSIGGIPFLVFVGGFISVLIIMALRYSGSSPSEQQKTILVSIAYIAMLVFVVCFFGSALKKEAFNYTHYPLRFNRRNRMVYVFRTDGTVLAKPWDEFYFTLSNLGEDTWEVRGLILNDKRDTVLEVCPLSIHDSFKSRNFLKQWEFIRRYMEEPDELPKLADQIEYVMDVADRRESFGKGMKCLELELGSLAILALPLTLFNAIGRMFAMLMSKIPQWPNEVEVQCQIDPNDPYLRDQDHLAPPIDYEDVED